MTPQGCVFVAIVTLIIVSLTVTYVAIYLSLLFQYNFIFFCIISPIFAILVILLLISYFRAACKSPGYPDQNTNKNYSPSEMAVFMQNAERHKNLKQQRRKKRTYDNSHQIQQLSETSYCDKCSTVKLPRVHHCKICERCIIRMDHHCPWVGNCIGRYNNKYFILFLFYATTGLGIMWATILADALMNWKYLSLAGDDLAIYLMGTVGIFSLLLFLSIGVLLFSQINGLNENVTTLESFIPGIEAHAIFKKENWHQNFEEVFGKSYWLLPTTPDLFEIPAARTQLTDQIQSSPNHRSPELPFTIQRQRVPINARNF